MPAFMPNWILTGIAAGLAAAAMQGAILVPSFLSVLIFLLSSLPLFVVGFSRGWASAGIGAVVAAILVMFFANLSLAISFFLTAGLAPVLAAMFSMISRTNNDDDTTDNATEGEARSAGREWYPEGRLVLWLAGVAAFITAASILTIGSDLATYEKFIGQMVAHLMTAFEKSMPEGQTPFPRAQAISLIVNALPIVAAAMWLFAMVASMRLAIVVLSFKNLNLRPWAKFSRMAYPANTVIALLVTLAAAYFTTGMIHILILGLLAPLLEHSFCSA